MFVNSGDTTPPTQLITRVGTASGTGAVVRGVAGRCTPGVPAGRRDAVDDGGTILVDFNARDERPDELATLEPGEVIKTRLHALGEV
jgi:hypothetical protein